MLLRFIYTCAVTKPIRDFQKRTPYVECFKLCFLLHCVPFKKQEEIGTFFVSLLLSLKARHWCYSASNRETFKALLFKKTGDCLGFISYL